MQIEMTISGLMVDPSPTRPSSSERRWRPARAADLGRDLRSERDCPQIENVATLRPMTHDLLRNIIQDLKATVERIVVSPKCRTRPTTRLST